ncbi:PaaI family thioesterase [Propionivibrio dicarboxylicus]|uniref:PaaI family thioesterase n=1 Tax=Propionivibrio dicarboxylicus TaxID=83767 RepID=UPI001C40B744|nr:PaaI family thioesterase [Propionivibrio dicarboxylicus]
MDNEFRLTYSPYDNVPSSDPIIPPPSHASCMACGSGDSLGLKFRAGNGNTVSTIYQPDSRWQGYPNQLHGGMISTMLDAAMTHCLFRQGIEAVTASLKVRFVEPIPHSTPLNISAKLTKRRRCVFYLNAEITVSSRVLARAEASFVLRNLRATPAANNAWTHDLHTDQVIDGENFSC